MTKRTRDVTKAEKLRPDKNSLPSEEATPEPVLRKPKCWESFFRAQRHPVLRSQCLTALMAGTPIVVDRVPTPALLDVLLLAFTARTYHEAEIVALGTPLLASEGDLVPEGDGAADAPGAAWDALKDRIREEWARPDFTSRVFASIHGRWADAILRGAEEFSCAEELYIPAMVEWYLAQQVPEYFSVELSDEVAKKGRRK